METISAAEFIKNQNAGVKTKKRRVQHERLKVRRPCVKEIRQLRAINYFKRWKFFHVIVPPDPGLLTGKQKTDYKLDGYEEGVFDMTIIAADEKTVRTWLIEFKWQYNGYTDSQKEVIKAATDTPVECVKIKSLSEFRKFIAENLR